MSTIQARGEFFKFSPPIFAQDRSAPFTRPRRPIIRPWVHHEHAGAFRFAIPEKLMRPPALEIPATPNRDLPDMRQLQRAINPGAATPARRTHIPIGVIVEGNERDRFVRRSKPQPGQMMKVTRAIKDKFRELRFDLAIKLVDHCWRSREADARAPLRGINGAHAVG